MASATRHNHFPRYRLFAFLAVVGCSNEVASIVGTWRPVDSEDVVWRFEENGEATRFDVEFANPSSFSWATRIVNEVPIVCLRIVYTACASVIVDSIPDATAIVPTWTRRLTFSEYANVYILDLDSALSLLPGGENRRERTDRLWSPQLLSVDNAVVGRIVAEAQDANNPLRVMKRDLRSLVSAQESYFADYTTYTTSLRTRFQPSDGVTFSLRRVTGTGWAARTSHVGTTRTCTIALGAAAGTGTEGEPVCS